MVSKNPRPNHYLSSTELSQRLVSNAMHPRPKPMPLPVELYKDLTPLDRWTYAAWGVALIAYLIWVLELL